MIKRKKLSLYFWNIMFMHFKSSLKFDINYAFRFRNHIYSAVYFNVGWKLVMWNDILFKNVKPVNNQF